MVGSSFGYGFGIPCWGDSISLELICNGKRMFAVHLVPQWDVSSCNYFVSSKGSLWADYSLGGLVDCCCLLWWEPGVRTCTRKYSTKGGRKKHGSVSHRNLPLHMAQGYSYCLYTQGTSTKEFNGRGEINSQILCWGKVTCGFEICAFLPHLKSPGKLLSKRGKWMKGACRKAYLKHGDCRGNVSGVKMKSDTEQGPLGSVLGPCSLKLVK